VACWRWSTSHNRDFLPETELENGGGWEETMWHVVKREWWRLRRNDVACGEERYQLRKRKKIKYKISLTCGTLVLG
jgi:hypothetical protein